MSLTKEEASKQLAEKVDQARNLLLEAEALADDNGLEFSWHPFYGGGGYYIGKGNEDWDEDDADGDGEERGYWRASSQMC